MRVNTMLCAARLGKEERHAISEFRRAVNMKITVEDNTRCNIATECKRLKTVSKRREVNTTKIF